MMKRRIVALAVSFLFAATALSAQTFEEYMVMMDSLSMEAPQIQTDFHRKYKVKNLDYGMTIGIERTPGGRIWNCFVAGGDNEDAYFVLNWSDDDGKTWTDSKYVIDPHDKSLPFARRTIVGQLWTDPLGRLWLFYDQSVTYYYGSSTNWYSICENPDDENPVWSEPQFLGIGCTLNKPTVMSTGEWVLPVSIWDRNTMAYTVLKDVWTDEEFRASKAELDPVRGAHVYVSMDQGKSWTDRGMTRFPHPTFDEHIIIELQDGRWWMTGRVGIGTNNSGIIQSFSSDKGYTWSEPEMYQPHISSRHFITRLASGNLVMVRHGRFDECTKTRTNLTAFISDDDGKTWKGGLLLDDTYDISYPTGFQAPDGYIYVSYDLQRTRRGEIYLVKMTEEDILAGKIVSPEGFLKHMIYKPGKVEKSKANIAYRKANTGCASETSKKSDKLRIIFETDVGNDVDDAMALDMLYKYLDQGKIDLLAVMINKSASAPAEYMDIMNTWYGYPDIPVGVVRNGSNDVRGLYADHVVAMKKEDGTPLFKRSHSDYGKLPDAHILYRKILAEQPDNSVIIPTVGFSTNLARLLDTPADEYSPLTGRELVAKKVKLLVAMAGHASSPEYREYNVIYDIPAAKKVLEEWPTPVVISPFEVGLAIKYPGTSIENDFSWAADGHPMVESYKDYLPMPHDRPTWDLTAVLYAVEGDSWFTMSEKCDIEVTEKGQTLFTPNENGNIIYMKVDEAQADAINRHFQEILPIVPASHQ